MKYGSSSVLLGLVGLAIVIAMIVNRGIEYMNEGFQMTPSNKIKALLNAIEFEGDSLQVKIPLIVENKIRLNGNALSLKAQHSNAECRLIFDDVGELANLRHKFMNTGSSTSMTNFGVDTYTGKRLVNVATKGRGVRVRVSGKWPHRSFRFKEDHLIDGNLGTITHSKRARGGWHELRLNQSYPIYKIVIENRRDGPERLKTPRIQLFKNGTMILNRLENVNQKLTHVIELNGIEADTFKIINEDNYLHLSQVKIFTKE